LFVVQTLIFTLKFVVSSLEVEVLNQQDEKLTVFLMLSSLCYLKLQGDEKFNFLKIFRRIDNVMIMRISWKKINEGERERVSK
jgi:hypothetical protein